MAFGMREHRGRTTGSRSSRTCRTFITEVNSDGSKKKRHEPPFRYSMLLPAFKGGDAVFGIEGLANPRGFI